MQQLPRLLSHSLRFNGIFCFIYLCKVLPKAILQLRPFVNAFESPACTKQLDSQRREASAKLACSAKVSHCIYNVVGGGFDCMNGPDGNLCSGNGTAMLQFGAIQYLVDTYFPTLFDTYVLIFASIR